MLGGLFPSPISVVQHIEWCGEVQVLGGRTITRAIIKAVGLSHEEYGHQEAK